MAEDPLKVLSGAIGGMFQPHADLVGYGQPGSAWERAGSPDTIPAEGLDWLGQFVGVRLTRGAHEDQRRSEIWRAAGWRRGTLNAMIAAVQATLTGTKSVVIRERYGGDAYVIRVETMVSETPDPSATERAARDQKVAGLILSYEALAGGTWDHLVGETWDDLVTKTWQNII